MIKPGIPNNEKSRLLALREIQIMNTPAEESFDNITELASFICNMPISLISLVDENKQWFKSKVGLEIAESKRDESFCSHAILNPDEIMEINDTRLDLRFEGNPFTMGDPPVLFYAGVPLKANNGGALGTLCVIDTKPNALNEKQKKALIALAKQVEQLFELRRKNNNLEKIKEELKERNNLLKDFAGVVSHDMKMPLANMILTTDILRTKYADSLDEQANTYLTYLKQSSFTLSKYITDILEHYESDNLVAKDGENFDIHHLLEEIIDLLNIKYDCIINLPSINRTLTCNRVALEQILLNLIGNSLKYNTEEKIIISVECDEDKDFYYFEVTDNGIGIPEDKKEDIFKLFTILAETDRQGNRGNGIGLSTVKKIVTSLGGKISVSSKVGFGTTFKFSILKTQV